MKKRPLEEKSEHDYRERIVVAYRRDIYDSYRRALSKRVVDPGIVLGEVGCPIADEMVKMLGIGPPPDGETSFLFSMTGEDVLKVARDLHINTGTKKQPEYFPVLVVAQNGATLHGCFKGN